MPFCDIVGHKKQLEALRRSLSGNRLHHAYLFVGPDGVGKKTVALSLAAAIHCAEKDDDFCGQCKVCLSVSHGHHPDVWTVAPQTGKRELTIHQIRELHRRLEFRSFSGKGKVVVIDSAHLMNYPTQNAFLKTLEEPPGDSLLILVANSAGALLPTLRSRCLSLSFASLPLDDMANVLASRRGLPLEEARTLAALAMGSLGEALTYDPQDLSRQRAKWLEGLSSLSRWDPAGSIALAEELAGDREKLTAFLDWLQGWYRDALICQVTGSTSGVRNIDMEEQVRVAASCPVGKILLAMSQVRKAAERVKRNYNRRLVLEELLFKLGGESRDSAWWG